MSRGRGGSPSHNSGGLEYVIFALVALLAGGTAIVWLAGNLAALLAGSGTLGIGPGEAAGVLQRLPGHLDDPAAAWPSAVRGELPGSTLIFIALVIAMLVVVGVLMLALWGLMRLQRMRRPEESAEWATARELRELHVTKAEQGRVVLGRLGRQLLAAEPRASVMVVAPAQSGKTTGMAVPAILEWDGPGAGDIDQGRPRARHDRRAIAARRHARV